MTEYQYEMSEMEAQEEAARYEEWMESMHYGRTSPSLPLMLNDPWIRDCPRTTDEIEAAFCTDQIIGGMPHGEERGYLHAILREAGYLPSGDTDNPTWTHVQG